MLDQNRLDNLAWLVYEKDWRYLLAEERIKLIKLHLKVKKNG